MRNDRTRQLLSLQQVAEWLLLSKRTVRELVRSHADPLPAFRVGGQLRFDHTEVIRWLERRRIKSEVNNCSVEVLLA